MRWEEEGGREERGKGGREERGKGGREEKRCMCVFCKLAGKSGEGAFAASLGSFAEHELWKIYSACVDTKLRGIEATCIFSGDRERPHISSYCKQRRPRWRPANKDSGFVSVYKYDKAELKTR